MSAPHLAAEPITSVLDRAVDDATTATLVIGRTADQSALAVSWNEVDYTIHPAGAIAAREPMVLLPSEIVTGTSADAAELVAKTTISIDGVRSQLCPFDLLAQGPRFPERFNCSFSLELAALDAPFGPIRAAVGIEHGRVVSVDPVPAEAGHVTDLMFTLPYPALDAIRSEGLDPLDAAASGEVQVKWKANWRLLLAFSGWLRDPEARPLLTQPTVVRTTTARLYDLSSTHGLRPFKEVYRELCS